MKNVKLEANAMFDDCYNEVKRILDNYKVPMDTEFIYDVAKRLTNEYGIGVALIEKLYALGYINGIRSERKRKALR